ncbi:MAG: hypothetical protein HLUCCA11_19825 [Phormidesmis priestleyi Ana]|uniref:Uncharacterized protein n=1 Tax=Phormidesmis priestleyi Ana TaxID=1666911 RepID=A0A0P7ZEE1_9CYAN|nr:MAG: hypothetical protein HLUCCA11_19825 [Phormidesmis priestleyi Ana]
MTQTDLHQAPSATCIDDGYVAVSKVAAALSRHERTVRQYIRLLRRDFGHLDFLEKRNGRFSGGDAARSLNHQQRLPSPHPISARCISFSNLPPPSRLPLRAPPKQIRAQIQLAIQTFVSHPLLSVASRRFPNS